MVSQRVILYFRLLAIIATLLLWGVSLVNGTVKALVLAVWYGKLSNGVPLRRSYLGIPGVDLLIALLVAFFFYGTNGFDEGYQLFLLDAYSSLQPAFVWLYVEAARPGLKPYWISRPIVFGLLWQCFGGAISLPLYYAIHLQWVTSGGIARVRDVAAAAAIPWSFYFGAALPATIGMSMTWFGPGSRTDDAQQLILGLWQPDPVWVSGIQATISRVIAAIRSEPSRSCDNSDVTKAHFWIRASYLLSTVVSAAGHLYSMHRIFASTNFGVNFVRLYVPFLFSGPSGVESEIFAFGPWLFLQYDLIIISLSSLSWVFFLLTATGPGQFAGLPRQKALLFLMLGTITVGPGATVSAALWYREGTLAQGLTHNRL